MCIRSWFYMVVVSALVLGISLCPYLRGQVKVGQCLGGGFRFVVGETCLNKNTFCIKDVCYFDDAANLYYKWQDNLLAGSCGGDSGVCSQCTGQLVVCTGAYYTDPQCMMLANVQLPPRTLPRNACK
jgi:hypothetical protein